MALKTDDNDQRLDPSQADYDKKFDDIRKNEENADFNDIVKNFDNPEQAENDANWTQNFTKAPSSDGKRFSFKRKGPIGALIAIIFGGGFGIIGLFGGPSLLLVQIEETFTGDARLNTQLTSMTVRTDQMLATKFNQSTDGVCGNRITILCRYSRPSNYLMKQMNKNGMTILDADGAEIVPNNNPFPNKRPATIRFTDSAGKQVDIKAADLLTQLNSNAEFRAAFRKAYNPRFISLADSIFGKIKARFGFNGQDKNKSADTAEKVNENLTEESAGADNGAKALVNEGEGVTGDATTSFLRKILGDKLGSMLEKLGQSGKGDAVGLVAGVACMATDVPSTIVKVVRAYQMTQVIKYAATFLIVAGAIKAGDATSTETAALGAALTTVVAGKSAMDSFGMRNAMFGDTLGADSKSLKFSPGYSVTSIPGFSQTAAVLGGATKQDICQAVGNPITGGTINALLGPETLGIGTVINVVAGIAIGGALQLAGPTIAEAVVKAIPKDFFSNILGGLLGDLTANLSGEDVGNALASGAEHMMSQTANAGGNIPLSVPQAVAYNKVTTQVDLAYAQEDRINNSPLDATNPNTALGSFVNQFMPYYADMLSVNGIFTMIGGIVSHPISLLTNTSAANAVDPANDYNQCTDPVIQSSKTAATPFCAISYGIPSQYLDMDPMQVMQDLQASGDIDDQGNPTDDNAGSQASQVVFGKPGNDTSTLKHWMDLCTDGSTDAIVESSNPCQISSSTDKKIVEYALYTIDHRVQQTMDGEDPAIGGSSDSSSTSNQSADATNSPLSNYTALLSSIGNQPTPKVIAGVSHDVLQINATQAAITTNRFALTPTPLTSVMGLAI